MSFDSLFPASTVFQLYGKGLETAKKNKKNRYRLDTGVDICFGAQQGLHHRLVAELGCAMHRQEAVALKVDASIAMMCEAKSECGWANK